MSDRRRLLLTLLNQGVWLSYSFEYLYHSLVPQTISGKNVRNKAKLGKIYGESEVRNQIVATSDVRPLTTTTTNGITFTNNNDGSITISGTASADFYQQITRDIPISVQGHSWLIFSELLGDNNKYWLTDGWTGAVINDGNAKIQVVNTSYVVLRFNIKSGVQINQTIHPQLVDLTKAYPFDTPTTLTDNRVQAILNRGYIPYNTGTIENTDIGEFSSEPYNLFDEEWRQGDINQITGELYNTGNNIRSTNLNSVIGGQTYTFEWDRTSCNTAVGGYTYLYIYEYDKNGNYIYFNDANHSGITVDNKQLTLTNETAYVRVKIYSSGSPAYSSLTKDIIKLCVHRTGTRTGYAPHKAPQTISFKYQGSGVGTSHDSMTIDKDNVVFTKDRALVDLGSLTYSISQDGTYIYSDSLNGKIKTTSAYAEIPNLLCPKLQPDSFNGTILNSHPYTINVSTIGSNSRLLISNTDNYTSGSNFATAMSGVMLEYQLATPQTITIPRKKLGVVDLGSLEWTYNSNGFFISAYSIANIGGKLPSSSDVQINAYCSQFLNATFNQVYDNSKDMSFGVNDIGSLIIRNNAFGTNATDFKNAMSGQYLFYETENEVADIVDTIGVEAGGTFTSDSEVLPNVDTKIKGK